MKKALLVIDWLNDFVEEKGALYVPSAERVKQNVKDIVDSAKDAGVPVLYGSDAHEPNDPEFKDWPVHAVKGTWGAELYYDIAPKSSDELYKFGGFYEKVKFNAFTNPQLANDLRAKGIKDIIEIGLVSNICILQSAIGAKDEGFNVYVVKDAIAELEDLDKDLEELAEYAKIIGKDEALKALGGK